MSENYLDKCLANACKCGSVPGINWILKSYDESIKDPNCKNVNIKQPGLIASILESSMNEKQKIETIDKFIKRGIVLKCQKEIYQIVQIALNDKGTTWSGYIIRDYILNCGLINHVTFLSLLTESSSQTIMKFLPLLDFKEKDNEDNQLAIFNFTAYMTKKGDCNVVEYLFKRFEFLEKTNETLITNAFKSLNNGMIEFYVENS